MADAPKIKKSGADSAASLVEDFLTDYEAYDGGTEFSDDPTVPYEHAIWLIEAAINYRNSVDPVGDTKYVDYSQSFTTTTTLQWGYSSGGGEALVSENDMLDVLDGLVSVTDGKAPISDLEITGSDGYIMNLQVKGVDITSVQPAINPLTFNDAYTAAIGGTCNATLPSGLNNYVQSPKDAAERITEAFGPYYLQNPNLPPVGWAITGWYHTIKQNKVLRPFNGGTLPYMWHWVSFYEEYDPVLQMNTRTATGTATRQHANLWGATEDFNNLPSRSPHECMGYIIGTNEKLNTWKTRAENLAQAEVNTFPYGGRVLEIKLLSYQNVIGNPLGSAFHYMQWKSGVFQTHGF